MQRCPTTSVASNQTTRSSRACSIRARCPSVQLRKHCHSASRRLKLFRNPSRSQTQILRQLKYSGMMETIRIRQQGFGMRIAHRQFLERYDHIVACMVPTPELNSAHSYQVWRPGAWCQVASRKGDCVVAMARGQ